METEPTNTSFFFFFFGGSLASGLPFTDCSGYGFNWERCCEQFFEEVSNFSYLRNRREERCGGREERQIFDENPLMVEFRTLTWIKFPPPKNSSEKATLAPWVGKWAGIRDRIRD